MTKNMAFWVTKERDIICSLDIASGCLNESSLFLAAANIKKLLAIYGNY